MSLVSSAIFNAMIGACCQQIARRYLRLKALALSAPLMESWNVKAGKGPILQVSRDPEGND